MDHSAKFAQEVLRKQLKGKYETKDEINSTRLTLLINKGLEYLWDRNFNHPIQISFFLILNNLIFW